MVKTYTRFVFLGKNILWLLVAATIALVVWIGSGNTGENGARMVFSNIPKSDTLQNIMAKPRYQGVDKNNKPYTIEADSGLQEDKDTVILTNIRADMTNENGAWMALNSGSGKLNSATKQLELTNGVEVFYDGGYQFRSDHAHVDINEGSAVGDAPIEGEGPAGTLEAQNFSIEERGKILHFNGSVRMLLYPAK